LSEQPWRIVVRPEGNNPGTDDDEDPKNTGGLVVYLDGGGYNGRQEVSRVAWVRENSLHPDVPFDEMLEAVIHRARTAVAKINELFEDAGNLQ
jgi:hypothetical protein